MFFSSALSKRAFLAADSTMNGVMQPTEQLLMSLSSLACRLQAFLWKELTPFASASVAVAAALVDDDDDSRRTFFPEAERTIVDGFVWLSPAAAAGEEERDGWGMKDDEMIG